MGCRRPEEKIAELGPALAIAIAEVNRVEAEVEFIRSVWQEVQAEKEAAIARRDHLAYDLKNALADRGSDGAGAFWVRLR